MIKNKKKKEYGFKFGNQELMKLIDSCFLTSKSFSFFGFKRKVGVRTKPTMVPHP